MKTGFTLSCWLMLSIVVFAAPDSNDKRLVLSPSKKLSLPMSAIVKNDTVTVPLTVVVPEQFKDDHHTCKISANTEYLIQAEPLDRWAVTDTSLTIFYMRNVKIKYVPVATQAFQMKFDFVNVDHPEKNSGTAALVITVGSGGQISSTMEQGKSDEKKVVSNEVIFDSVNSKDVESDGSNWSLWILLAFFAISFFIMILVSIMSSMRSRNVHEADATDSEKIDDQEKLESRQSQTELPKSQNSVEEAKVSDTGKDTLSESGDDKNQDGLKDDSDEKDNLEKETTQTSSEITASATITESKKDSESVVEKPNTRSAEDKELLQSVLAASSENLVEEDNSGKASSLEEKSLFSSAFTGEPKASKKYSSFAEGLAKSMQEQGETSARPKWEILSDQNTGENIEDIAVAIDGVVAAASTDPLIAPQEKVSHNLDKLQKTADHLKRLAMLCHKRELDVVAESVEVTTRKAYELLFSYQEWASDQTLKLSLTLPRHNSKNKEVRKEVVESVLDSLYETRKMAIQGPIYFDRRIMQLFDYDLPKLRKKFQDIESEPIKDMLEEIS